MTAGDRVKIAPCAPRQFRGQLGTVKAHTGDQITVAMDGGGQAWFTEKEIEPFPVRLK